MSEQSLPSSAPPSDPLTCWFCHAPVKVIEEREGHIIYACTACGATGAYPKNAGDAAK